MESRRKKLLRILNYTAEQKKLIKLLKTPGYQRFAEVVENRERFMNIYTSEDIDNLIEFFEKLIKTFEKKDIKKIIPKLKKIYIHKEIENITHKLLKTQKLNKTGRFLLDENYTKGEIEVWKAEGVEYYLKVEDIMRLKGQNPKLYVSQIKNISLLMCMVQEQQFYNEKKEVNCEFMLSRYAERRGYTKEEIKRGGDIFNQLRRDLYTGAYTTYRIDKVMINGHEYTAHGIPNFYTLLEPKDYDGVHWIAKFNDPWKSWIMEILNKKARQYFIVNPKAIEDRATSSKPYLLLFYMQLRRRANLLANPKKIIELLEDMKLPDKILISPKRCFELLKECLIYFSIHYQPTPEIESFNLYNNFHRTKTVKLPLSISEAFKNYFYEDFKGILKAIGIKDIREAFISFKKPYKKPEGKIN